MPAQGSWYRHLDDVFERPWVFNLYQSLADGGKKRRIRRFLEEVPHRSVVDVGCGTGNWASVAMGEYLGIDQSPSFIEACRRRYAGDPDKRFLQADVAEVELQQKYDLAQLISVLHHLSDDDAVRVVDWAARSVRHLFVLDLYPIPWNPVARFLYAMDRGNYVRTPEAQKALILGHPGLELVREDDYFAPTGLYRHTLFLFRTAD